MRVSMLLALVGMALIGLCVCDTPASCMTDQVLGEWVFSLSRAGDELPTSDQMDCSAYQTKETYKVVLMSPNLAFDTDGLGGTWTMIYNQGFEVTIGGRKLFHFFKWDEAEDGTVTSYCGDSMPGMGWAHKATIPPTRWQCYSATKAVPIPPTTYSVKSHPLSESPMARPFAHVSGPITDRYLEGQSSWYSVEHPMWHDLPHSTIQRMGGSVRQPVERMAETNRVWSHPSALVEDSMFGSETYQHRVGAVLTGDLPTNWDWRDIDGTDYVTAVRDQGHCGSCFSFSTTGAIAFGTYW
ncbi:peptidase C1A [Kipferlia bialata]|uniref:Peptidase C1A n=1 Tax=Kipferlia bialata TaxID=797122 RepID=A0A9K3D456_9EUKA|nr:peptidase C1A [Kipferlia bialata]|eukprot:g9586.t1